MDHVSRKRLKAVSKALKAGTATAEDERDFARHLQRCDDVLAKAQGRLEDDGFLLATPVPCAVQGRLKTRITLLEKLRRMQGSTLTDIRDIVGLRVVGDLTLDEQTAVARGAMEQLGVTEDLYKLVDRRQKPSPGGYRALHVDFRLDGVRCELQVRTRRQHVWAEAYERFADVYGRDIRYETDGVPDPRSPAGGVVQAMEQLSMGVRAIESAEATLAHVSVLAEAGALPEEYLTAFAETRAEVKEADETVDAALRELSRLSSIATATVKHRTRRTRGRKS